ncbi:hypothetical protein P9112_000371 [Eukaryota sp. TZLM1-RC]
MLSNEETVSNPFFPDCPVCDLEPLPENSKPEYHLHKGLRWVRPYYFSYRANAKLRWLNRPLIEVMEEQFFNREPGYWENRIKQGFVTVNGETKQPCHVINDRGGVDVIRHRTLRLEEPVLDQLPVVIGETDQFVAINKPSSLPCHPGGRFNFNTLEKILQHVLCQKGLRLAHRLDRVTSGVLIYAKKKEGANVFRELLISNSLSKTYIALVDGCFPADETTCTALISEPGPPPLFQRKGIEEGEGEGQTAKTVMTRLWTNDKKSIVACQPITGRCHQIRIHLKFLGHPIANDLLYNDSLNLGYDASDPRFMEIYLHAIRYSGKQFDFRAPSPPWLDDLGDDVRAIVLKGLEELWD